MALIRTTAPAAPIVTDARLWEHLRVDLIGSPAAPEDADYISLLRDAVTHTLDGAGGILGRALITQEWRWTLPAFPPRECPLRVPLPPLQSVDDITYLDGNAASQTLTGFRVLPGGENHAYIAPALNTLWPDSFDTPQAITIDFTAGYGDSAEDIDSGITAAALLWIKDLYEHRETVNVGNVVARMPAVDWLLTPKRIDVIA